MSMKPPSKNRRKKFSKSLLIVGATLLLLGIGVAVPLLMTDGTEKYSGVEQAVAKNELRTAEELQDGIDRVSTMHLKVRVESVRPAQAEDANKFCGTAPSEKTEGNYTVFLSYRTFFGIETGKLARYNCPPPSYMP